MKTIIKISKRMVLMIFAFMFTINLVQAQPGGPKGPPPIPNDKQVKDMVVKLAVDLSLNDSQIKQVSALYIAHFKEVRLLVAKNKETKETNRQVMEQLKSKFQKNVKSVLTKEQQKEFDVFQKKNRPHGGKPKDKKSKI